MYDYFDGIWTHIKWATFLIENLIHSLLAPLGHVDVIFQKVPFFAINNGNSMIFHTQNSTVNCMFRFFFSLRLFCFTHRKKHFTNKYSTQWRIGRIYTCIFEVCIYTNLAMHIRDFTLTNWIMSLLCRSSLPETLCMKSLIARINMVLIHNWNTSNNIIIRHSSIFSLILMKKPTSHRNLEWIFTYFNEFLCKLKKCIR